MSLIFIKGKIINNAYTSHTQVLVQIGLSLHLSNQRIFSIEQFPIRITHIPVSLKLNSSCFVPATNSFNFKYAIQYDFFHLYLVDFIVAYVHFKSTTKPLTLAYDSPLISNYKGLK